MMTRDVRRGSLMLLTAGAAFIQNPCVIVAGNLGRRELAELQNAVLAQSSSMQDPSSVPTGAVVGAILAAMALVISVAAYIIRDKVWVRPSAPKSKGKSKQARASGEEAGKGGKGETETAAQTSLIYMTFNDVQIATEGFKPEGLLSESTFATVHFGEGPNGEQWAIKCAKEISLQGEHLFRNEVEFLARIVHQNIVSLRGFCDEGDEQILIFDFMPNGSLASWLRPPPDDEREALPLKTRYSIAVGVAEALKFLHSFSQPKIIHRDLQSDSVLLDQSMQPKVGGLGLLKHLPGDALRLRMGQKKGYLDPEYFQTYKVTTKCDVYAFGVILFELLTGCAPLVSVMKTDGQKTFTLSQWAKQAVSEGKLEEILDPRMEKEETTQWAQMIQSMSSIACACVAPTRRHRPDMAKVSEMLLKLEDGQQLARSDSFASTSSSRSSGSSRAVSFLRRETSMASEDNT